MKLYGHDTSPYVRRVRALLLELELPFERDKADWQNPSADFLRASPIGRLPAFTVQEGGKDLTLFDSAVIAEYLLSHHARVAAAGPKSSAITKKERFRPFQPTLFADGQRYEDENVLTTIDAALDSAIQIFIFERDGIKRESAPYLIRQGARIDKCLAWLEVAYEGRTSLHDGFFGFVDLSLACCLDWMIFRKARDLSAHPNLLAFYEKSRLRPSLIATDPRTPSA